ncbi:hypothetical protein VCHE48_3806 [Vibrio cholerae HE48]|nr:hypothetical protein VCHE48_3806 [Vibrio cholerae HE48]
MNKSENLPITDKYLIESEKSDRGQSHSNDTLRAKCLAA